MAEDIIARLGLEVDSDGVLRATKNLDDLTRKSGNAERATDGVTGASQRSKVAMVAYAVAAAAVTTAITKSISLHKEFGAAVQDLSAITGATGKDLEFYKEQALAIGESTTLSATQAVTAFKLIASAKPDLLASKEALAEVTFEAVKLAEAAGVEMTEAADALGSSLNQFGKGADQASRFINVLAAGAKFGASEIRDTSIALREAGTVASSAGLSFEETNAAIQSLSTVAIKGSKAGTALRNILVNLQTQSDDSINPSIVGLATALENLEKKELTTAEQAKLFGKEQLAAAQALVKNSAQVRKLTGDLSGTSVAYEQASIKTNSLEGDQKKLNSAWEAVSLTLGQEFDPALRATTQLITDLAKPAKQAILEFTDLGDAIGAYAAVAASVLALDFDGAKAIIQARKEEREEVEKKIAKIWEEKSATDELAESKRKAAEAGKAAVADSSEQAVEAEGVLGDTGKSTLDTETGLGVGDNAAVNQSAIDSLRARYMTEQALAQENRDKQIELVQLWLQEDFTRKREADNLFLEIEQEFEDEKTRIAEGASKNRRALLAAELGATANILRSASALMGKEGKKQSAMQKTLAKASIIASTAQAVMNALAVSPYPLGLALAAGAALKGAEELSKVGGGGGGSDTGSLTSPAGFNQDSLASNVGNPPQVQGRGNFPENVNLTIEGVVTEDATEAIVDSMRELFSDGGRQFE